MFYHIDFPIQQKDPESAWQKQLARERAKQEEREANAYNTNGDLLAVFQKSTNNKHP